MIAAPTSASPTAATTRPGPVGAGSAAAFLTQLAGAQLAQSQGAQTVGAQPAGSPPGATLGDEPTSAAMARSETEPPEPGSPSKINVVAAAKALPAVPAALSASNEPAGLTGAAGVAKPARRERTGAPTPALPHPGEQPGASPAANAPLPNGPTVPIPPPVPAVHLASSSAPHPLDTAADADGGAEPARTASRTGDLATSSPPAAASTPGAEPSLAPPTMGEAAPDDARAARIAPPSSAPSSTGPVPPSGLAVKPQSDAPGRHEPDPRGHDPVRAADALTPVPPAAPGPTSPAPNATQAAATSAAPVAVVVLDSSHGRPAPTAADTGSPTPPPAPPSLTAQMASAVTEPVRVVLSAPPGQGGAGHTVTVQLTPAELGRVEVRIERTADGPARIELSVERPETLQRLLQDQSQLHQALNQAGIPAHDRSVHFSLATDSGASFGSSFAGGSPQGGGAGGGSQRPFGAATPQPAWSPDDPETITAATLRTGLDITA